MALLVKNLCLLFVLFGTCQAVSRECAKRHLRETEARCVKLQLTPDAYWRMFLNLDYPNDPITRSHLRCLGIMGDLYDDETGPKLDNLYELYEEVTPLTREAWYQEKFCCLDNVYANGYPEDLGQRVLLTFSCFRNDFLATVGN